jgi:hypothetical protein
LFKRKKCHAGSNVGGCPCSPQTDNWQPLTLISSSPSSIVM